MLISKQKLNQLVTSIKTNCITILQGPPGCLKTSTLTSQFHTFYIENYKRFVKHFNSDILRTDIDNKKDLIDFITRFKGHKIIIETRCTISNTELEIIRTKIEVSVELVTFNALSDIKLKKLGGDSKLHNNIHNLKYNMENVQIISFYHFLGKLFYKSVELKCLEYYEPSKVLDYVRQNFVYFMDDLYVIELMSENCVYVTEIVVLYINQAVKKRPNKFFGFSSLDQEEKRSEKFIYF